MSLYETKICQNKLYQNIALTLSHRQLQNQVITKNNTRNYHHKKMCLILVIITMKLFLFCTKKYWTIYKNKERDKNNVKTKTKHL